MEGHCSSPYHKIFIHEGNIVATIFTCMPNGKGPLWSIATKVIWMGRGGIKSGTNIGKRNGRIKEGKAYLDR